jgi:hypothetical protein
MDDEGDKTCHGFGRGIALAADSAPTLLLPSIQTTIRAGRFPAVQSNGVRYLMIPVTFKGGAEAF